LLGTPPTVTKTGPVVVPTGTGTTIEYGPQVDGTAMMPLNVMVLDAWDAPRFSPEMVTIDPGDPLTGLRLKMLGPTTVVKLTAFVGIPT